jgi:hypothetical protein
VLDAVLGFTTPAAQLEAVATIDPVNLAWDGTCSVTSGPSCAETADCPGGEQCVATAPELSFKHQVSLMDHRTVSGVNTSAGRGIVQVQLADAGPDSGFFNPVAHDGTWACFAVCFRA